jgi:hypothetical protein
MYVKSECFSIFSYHPKMEQYNKVLGDPDLARQMMSTQQMRSFSARTRRASSRDAIEMVIGKGLSVKQCFNWISDHEDTPFIMRVTLAGYVGRDPVDISIHIISTDTKDKYFLFSVVDNPLYSRTKMYVATLSQKDIQSLSTGINADLLYALTNRGFEEHSDDQMVIMYLSYMDTYKCMQSIYRSLRQEDPEIFDSTLQTFVLDCMQEDHDNMDPMILYYWIQVNCADLGIYEPPSTSEFGRLRWEEGAVDEEELDDMFEEMKAEFIRDTE